MSCLSTQLNTDLLKEIEHHYELSKTPSVELLAQIDEISNEVKNEIERLFGDLNVLKIVTKSIIKLYSLKDDVNFAEMFKIQLNEIYDCIKSTKIFGSAQESLYNFLLERIVEKRPSALSPLTPTKLQNIFYSYLHMSSHTVDNIDCVELFYVKLSKLDEEKFLTFRDIGTAMANILQLESIYKREDVFSADVGIDAIRFSLDTLSELVELK